MAQLLDSPVLGAAFGTPEMRRVFDEETTLQRWLDVEAALARAQAAVGIVPAWAAEEIARRAQLAQLDLERLSAEAARTQHPVVSVLRQLEELCERDAGQYLHWGATTQDITDTAIALALKEAYGLLERQLAVIAASLRSLARAHRDTAMVGRTHGQHATPITFGFKVAVWLAELDRHRIRLHESRPRVLVGQLAGAVGTLAVLGESGLQVQRIMFDELELARPLIAWHTARDGLAELACVLGLIAGTTGKVANELIELQRTEVSEVFEAASADHVGSSTMPHKRNPIASERVVAMARLVRGETARMLDLMMHQHERDLRASYAERAVIPGACVIASGMLEGLRDVLDRLDVDADRMRMNLESTAVATASEHVMMVLAERIGRQRAHELVRQALRSSDAAESVDALLAAASRAGAALERGELDRLIAEGNSAVGLSGAFVDDVVQQSEALEPRLAAPAPEPQGR
jgi:3-carboxy-cis,cis-muconate cycloisomerase